MADSRGAPAVIDAGSSRITRGQVNAYAALTEDANPIHLDDAFAARSPFGRPIVHGTLLMAPVWSALAAEFGTPALRGARVECRFSRPVFVGDEVHVRGERVDAAAEPSAAAAAAAGPRYAFRVTCAGGELHAVVDVWLCADAQRTRSKPTMLAPSS